MVTHKHQFKILWHSEPEYERPMTQLLYCPECDTKFWGFGGSLGKPEFMHQLKNDMSFTKYLSTSNVIE